MIRAIKHFIPDIISEKRAREFLGKLHREPRAQHIEMVLEYAVPPLNGGRDGD